MDLNKELEEGLKVYEKLHHDFVVWLDNIRDKDEVLFTSLKDSMPLAIDFIKKSSAKDSLMTMYDFVWHLGIIKNGIFDLCLEDNLYSVKILYRTFLEHWLKSQYIWARFTKEKNNAVGEEYLIFCGIDEDVKYGKSIKDIAKILNIQSNDNDIWDAIFDFKPELKKYDKADIKSKVCQFEYKKIIKFLVDNNASGSEWVANIVSEYSELSSFVHGGPRTINQRLNYALENKRFEDYKGIINFAFNMYRINIYSVYLALVMHGARELMPFLRLLKPKDLEIKK